MKKPLHIVKCKQAELASQRDAASQEKALKSSPHLTALQGLPALLGDQKSKRKLLKAAHPFSLGAGSSKPQCSRSTQAPTPCLLGHLQSGVGPHGSREVVSHLPASGFQGPARAGAGLWRDRPPRPAWASWKPSESTQRQHAQGPCRGCSLGRITRGKTGNINTGFVLVWPSEAGEKQREFPRSKWSVCRGRVNKTEGCEPSLPQGFGPPAWVLGLCPCAGERARSARRDAQHILLYVEKKINGKPKLKNLPSSHKADRKPLAFYQAVGPPLTLLFSPSPHRSTTLGWLGFTCHQCWGTLGKIRPRAQLCTHVLCWELHGCSCFLMPCRHNLQRCLEAVQGGLAVADGHRRELLLSGPPC